jgi:hypothetical protein
MASSHVRPRRASGFATARYIPDAEGVLRPQVLPTTCLARPGQAGEESCRIDLHHWRKRKTGPKFPLAVLCCWTHALAFTLYPPGHYPYGRHALAPLAPSGEVLRDPDQPHQPAWQGTLFAAAVDASQGLPWPREVPGADEPELSDQSLPEGHWNTQVRHIKEAASLLGLSPAADARLGEKLAARLEIEGLVLRDAQRDFAEARGYRARGCALRPIIDLMPPNPSLASRLLGCAAASGYCGPIIRWESSSRGPRPVLFPGRGTPAG